MGAVATYAGTAAVAGADAAGAGTSAVGGVMSDAGAALHNAADVNGDGKLDADDLKAAVENVGDALEGVVPGGGAPPLEQE